jgi:hypothetical protein
MKARLLGEMVFIEGAVPDHLKVSSAKLLCCVFSSTVSLGRESTSGKDLDRETAG